MSSMTLPEGMVVNSYSGKPRLEQGLRGERRSSAFPRTKGSPDGGPRDLIARFPARRDRPKYTPRVEVCAMKCESCRGELKLLAGPLIYSDGKMITEEHYYRCKKCGQYWYEVEDSGLGGHGHFWHKRDKADVERGIQAHAAWEARRTAGASALKKPRRTR